MLANVRIVLVDTSHPGNIGAVARAMKNMGLSALHLVRPKQFPHAEASARASGADDVLDGAQVHDDLLAAVGECGLVVGTSARSRHIPFDPLTPRDCAAQLVARVAAGNQVAVVFGSERTGLQNAELKVCNHLMTIPTNDEYSSLNIAMAVQIMAYELLLAVSGTQPAMVREEPLATVDDMERFYTHLQAALEGTHFRDHSGSGHLMARVRRIFNRIEVDRNELRILRGMLSALEQRSKPGD